MRSWKSAVGVAAILLLLTPASAHAWWGWLDDLSGPGKFKGRRFDVRLMCFGEESEAKRLVDGLKNANALTAKMLAGNEAAKNARVQTSDLAAMTEAWRQVMANLETTKLTFPVLDVDRVRTVAANLSERLAKLPKAAPDAYMDVELDGMRTFLDASNSELQPLIEQVVRGISSISSTGVFLSACSTDTKRRSSIELDADFWRAAPAPGFAGGQEIQLTTLMGEFSFRVFTDPRFDVVDAGVGAGAYWFTSTGFNSFSGVVLQPARFDFHAPTLWSTYRLMDRSGATRNGLAEALRRLAAVPTFRFSLMEFPSGFSPDAFAGTGSHHVQIPGELVKSWSLFLNFEPFIRKPPFVNKTK